MRASGISSGVWWLVDKPFPLHISGILHCGPLSQTCWYLFWHFEFQNSTDLLPAFWTSIFVTVHQQWHIVLMLVIADLACYLVSKTFCFCFGNYCAYWPLTPNIPILSLHSHYHLSIVVVLRTWTTVFPTPSGYMRKLSWAHEGLVKSSICLTLKLSCLCQ